MISCVLTKLCLFLIRKVEQNFILFFELEKIQKINLWAKNKYTLSIKPQKSISSLQFLFSSNYWTFAKIIVTISNHIANTIELPTLGQFGDLGLYLCERWGILNIN